MQKWYWAAGKFKKRKAVFKRTGKVLPVLMVVKQGVAVVVINPF